MSGRSLNNYYLTGGEIATLQTDTTRNNRPCVVPENGELSGIACNNSVILDGDVVLSIYKNNVDTGETFTLADTTAGFTGQELQPSGKVFVTAGDVLEIETDDGQTAACILYVTFQLRR